MTNKFDNIKFFRKINTKFGVAKANETIVVKESGTIEFQNYKLKEVVYIPELSKNFFGECYYRKWK